MISAIAHSSWLAYIAGIGEVRHGRLDAALGDVALVVDADARVLVLIFDHAAAFAIADQHARHAVDDACAGMAEAGRILGAAARPEGELARRLGSEVEMLVEPFGRRAEDRERPPIDAHDLVLETVLVGFHADLLGPHERIALGAQDEKDGAALMVMRLVIAADRPFDEMAGEGVG